MHNAANGDSHLKMLSVEILIEKGRSSDCVCEHQYQHCKLKTLDNSSTDAAEFKEAVTKPLPDG